MKMLTWWKVPQSVEDAWHRIGLALGASWFPIVLYVYMNVTSFSQPVRVFFLLVGIALLTIIVPGISYLVHEYTRAKTFAVLKPVKGDDLWIVCFLIVLYIITWFKFI